MTRVAFLIRTLNYGGTERQLVELLKALDKSKLTITVLTYYDAGSLRSEVAAIAGVEVLSLHKRGRWDLLPFFVRLVGVLRRLQPDVLYSFAPAVNVIGLFAGRLAGSRVVWGLRASDKDLVVYGGLAVWSFRIGAWLSRCADLIIVNSAAGKSHHVSQGFSAKQMIVVQNGIDIALFKPDAAAGALMRAQWGVTDSTPLIGIVARFSPVKGHRTFLPAAALLAQTHPDVRFVLIGDGPADYKAQLHALADKLGVADNIIWAGSQRDMPAVYNALDIASSASDSEGFPNVVAEAMACGRVCVATAAGDSRLIIGDTGAVVPPLDPAALANAWAAMLARSAEERAALGVAARARVTAQYSTQSLAGQTRAALLKVAS